jgi:hypothetical protein
MSSLLAGGVQRHGLRNMRERSSASAPSSGGTRADHRVRADPEFGRDPALITEAGCRRIEWVCLAWSWHLTLEFEAGGGLVPDRKLADGLAAGRRRDRGRAAGRRRDREGRRTTPRSGRTPDDATIRAGGRADRGRAGVLTGAIVLIGAVGPGVLIGRAPMSRGGAGLRAAEARCPSRRPHDDRGRQPLVSGPVFPHVTALIPYTIVVDLRTGGNWERTGVVPDVPQPEGGALAAVVALLRR